MKTLLITAIALFQGLSHATTIAELSQQAPPKLFIATKGAVMPNTMDQANNLEEGERALLLSGKELTDLTGISKLMVEDDGKVVPVTSVKHLHLFLNENKITRIPDEIAELDNVEFLYLEHNKLSSLPSALAKMDALEGMYFTDNRFTEIPAFVINMTRLKKLQFSQNEITVLPPEIGNLIELRHFNMANNRITAIPDTVSKFYKLRVCDLSDNPITSLPESFGKVQIVNQLRVKNCPITTLPTGFATMRATIDITGTKIDLATLSPELRAKISTEKPPGSKPPEKIIVKKAEKKKD